MNGSTFVTVAALLFGSVTPAAHADGGEPQDVFAARLEQTDRNQTPQAFMSQWAAAFAANNAARHIALYEPSADTEVIASAGNRLAGIKQIERAYRLTYENMKFSESKLKRLTVREIGNVSLVSFEHLFEFASVESGEAFRVHIQTTMVLQRKDDRWRIVQEHSSPIVGVPRVTPISGDVDSSERRD